MKLVVRAVGKLRDRAIASLCEDYLGRVRRHLPVEVIEVDREPQLYPAELARTVVIALDPAGQELSTPELRALLAEHMSRGTHALAFLIGGADGLSDDTRRRAQRVLSLSRLTFPHRLARAILCEQLYRCVSALRGEPYDRP